MTTHEHTHNLVVLDSNASNEWIEVHAAGCSDLTKRRGINGRPKGQDAWHITAATLEDAADNIASDFIAEGSMTLEEAITSITWFPCVHLPRLVTPAMPPSTFSPGHVCVPCDHTFSGANALARHLRTAKHARTIEGPSNA